MKVLFVFSCLLAVALTALVGGWSEKNTSDPTFMNMAWKAMKLINAETNDVNTIVPVEILCAKTQVVAGTNTEIDVKVQESNCPKGELHEKCTALANGKSYVYEIRIFEQPWTNTEEITFSLKQ